MGANRPGSALCRDEAGTPLIGAGTECETRGTIAPATVYDLRLTSDNYSSSVNPTRKETW
jgi:hypothetical protein